MKNKLAIVILNWNGKDFLQRFLPILITHTPSYAEIIVADNASTDDSLQMLQQEFPQIRTIKNKSNGGFSKGYNDALASVDAEYYCLLNSDIEVTENWVDPIIRMMDEDAEIGAVQPKLRSYHQRDYFEYAGASGGFLDRYGYPFCRGRLFETTEKDKGQYDTPIEIFWATGASLFVRSDVYHKLGGLDEFFFAHMEEIDFCWRVKNSGYKIMVQPKSVVYHVGGGTLPKKSKFKTYLNFRNNLYLLLKNLPGKRLPATFIMRFFLDNVAAFVFLLRGNAGEFVAVYKAMFDFLKGFRKMYKKRGTGSKEAFQSTWQTAVVFLYYIKKRQHFNGEKFFK